MPTVAHIQPVNSLSSIDLRAERAEYGGAAYLVRVADSAEPAEMLITGDRAGLAWGAGATWTDVLPGETPALVAARMLLSDEQIEALRDEASVAGDEKQIAICDRALGGHEAARAECARVLRDAATM